MAWPVLARETTNTPINSTWRDAYIFERKIPPIAKINPETYSKQYIEDLIRLKSAEAGINGDLMVKVAFCESKMIQKWNYMNPTGDPNSKWSAYGIFQIIRGHQKKYGIDRMTIDGNIALAIELYKKNGTQDWELSSSCWK